jgi:outer membrane receptor protein involved in Fe transport
MAMHFRVVAGLLAATSCGALASPAAAQSSTPAPAERSFDIPPGDLSPALQRFARQARTQVLYSATDLKGKRTKGVSGKMSTADALERLVEGSGADLVRDPSGAFLVRSRSIVESNSSGENQAGSAAANSESAEIIVTGTLIRGGTPVGGALYKIDRTDIDRSGRGTVQDLFQTVSQNFAGPSSEAALGAGRTGSVSTPFGQGSGLNLRGVGSDATLVLLNGRRLAPSGLGDYVDVSSIPLALVDHVDILPDGASATYGSDALAGVVNIVLKQKVDGAETRLRFSHADGLDEISASQAVGTSWSSGHILAGVDYYRHGTLEAGERDYTASADLRPFGGTDFRSGFSNPGNIIGPAGLVGAIPAGQDGTALTASQILAGQRNLTNQNEGAALLPRQKRWSFLASGRQDLNDRLYLYADGLYARRDSDQQFRAPAQNLSVPTTNAYRQLNGLGLPGTAPITITYDLTPEVGFLERKTRATVGQVTGGLKYAAWSDWQFDIHGTYSEADNRFDTQGIDSRSAALGGTLATALASGVIASAFNPFGDRANSNGALLSSFIFDDTTRTENRQATFSVQADGTLFDLAAGGIRLALGAEYRDEHFSYLDTQFFASGTIPVPVRRSGSRGVKAAYGELFVPIFAPHQQQPGFHRLELSASFRVDDHEGIGSTSNPRIGLRWDPIKRMTFRGTYGTSFKAPRLNDLLTPQTIQFIGLPAVLGGPDPDGNGVTSLVATLGGNPNLKPEKGRTWTLGVDVSPTDEVKLSATYFDLHYDNRIATFTNILGAFANPSLYLNSVYFLDPSAALIDRLTEQSSVVVGTPFTTAEALLLLQPANISVFDMRGVDFQANWSHAYGFGRLGAYANITYLLDNKQSLTATSPRQDVLDTLYNPLSLRGRAGLSYERDSLTYAAAVNFTGDYKDLTGTNPRKIDANLTFDLSASYAFNQDLQVNFAVNNLFDKDPPFANAQGFGFDATNFSPVGRQLSIGLVKRW